MIEKKTQEGGCMNITKPLWDRDFQCLAGDCPDTCCAGWEIPVDEQSVHRFCSMEGPLGERLRQALVTVEGETQFVRKDGRCVLLNEQNLCALYAACGEEALCRTCHLHPRFVVQYGGRREIMPGLSCPAWVKAYLMREEEVVFVTEETNEEITEYMDVDGLLFLKLLKAREKALGLVQERSLSIKVRLRQLLQMAQELEDEKEGSCPQSGVLAAYIEKLESLEVLSTVWMAQLKKHHSKCDVPVESAQSWTGFRSAVAEKLLVYDLFRFMLQGVYTGRVLPWVKLAVFHVLVVLKLGEDCQTKEELCEVARLYSKEIEHCAENGRALYHSFCRRSGRYSVAGLLRGMEELA